MVEGGNVRTVEGEDGWMVEGGDVRTVEGEDG